MWQDRDEKGELGGAESPISSYSEKLEFSWVTNGFEEGQFKAVSPSVSLGKEIRTANKNSVANHYSRCLDSPLLGLPKPLIGPGTGGREAT